MNLIFLPIQILLLFFLLFVFTRVVLRFKEGTIPLGMFLFWAGLWAVASASILWPDSTTLVAQRLGIGRGVDAVIYLALIIMFYLIFRLTVAMENLRHQLTRLIREIALKDNRPAKKRSRK